jgi:Domain of unknown function (DUF4232)
MRPARIITTVVFAAAIAITGCSAHSTATRPSPAPQPPAAASPPKPVPTTTPPPDPGPGAPPPAGGPSGDRPSTDRCSASALAGSVQGTDGAAGTIWYSIRLRNTSTRICTAKGVPEVRLLDAQGRPVTAPSVPDRRPGWSLVVLRPQQAARFVFAEPNGCEDTVAGSRLSVRPPSGQGAVVVPLGAETRFGTCRRITVQALQGPTRTPFTPADRIADPQLAADHLVAAWVGRDRGGARRLTSQAVTDQLFRNTPPARQPESQPCRLVELGVYLCSYPLGRLAELDVWVRGGASVGYGVSAVEFVD